MSYLKQKLEEKPLVATVGFGYQGGRRPTNTTVITEEQTKAAIKDTKYPSQ